MIKQFKHPKLGWVAICAMGGYYYCENIGENKTEQELLALGFEEVKDTHFGNGMIIGGGGMYVNTTQGPGCRDRVSRSQPTDYVDDWCCFYNYEQAEQFEKMMMTVRKIWKWKKENDDVNGQEYCLFYNKDIKEFDRDDHDTDYVYSFILPKFSGSRVVNQLISDLGEELNNLLCWIK